MPPKLGVVPEIPTTKKQCWPLFHKWSIWTDTLVSSGGLYYWAMSRKCSKCEYTQTKKHGPRAYA